MAKLRAQDIQMIVQTLPRDVKALLKETAGRVFLAGGAIRARITGEPVSDYDLWGQSKQDLGQRAELFAAKRGVRLMSTANAHTILTEGRTPVQFITRWVFDRPEECVHSFDFTIAGAAIWYEAGTPGCWTSYCHEDFYADLAAKRLVYQFPDRNEDAGGSLMRVQKFLHKGYSISPGNLAAVIARLTMRLREKYMRCDEPMRARILLGLLREVDPLVVVDGVELVSEDANTTDPELAEYYQDKVEGGDV